MDSPLTRLGGPEDASLLERLVNLFRLPYPLGSLLLALACGSPSYYLGQYLDTGSPHIAADPNGLIGDLLYVIMPFYAFLAVRYMRVRIVEAEPKLSLMSLDGEESYHKAFRGVTQSKPALLISVVIFPIVIYGILPFPGPFSIATSVISTAINVFAYSSIVWIYISSVRGLHLLGKTSLRFKPFYEDEMLGAGPMGSLSLSLTFVYFGGLFLAGLIFVSNPILLTILLALSLTGVISFFLPLMSIHRRMRQVKQQELAEVRKEFGRLLQTRNSLTATSNLSAMEELRDFQAHEYLERKAERIHTWPFDLQVLQRFVAIILSVTAILLSRIIQIALHL